MPVIHPHPCSLFTQQTAENPEIVRSVDIGMNGFASV